MKNIINLHTSRFDSVFGVKNVILIDSWKAIILDNFLHTCPIDK